MTNKWFILLNIITNCFIIAGVSRHWYPHFHNNNHNDKEAGTHGLSQTQIPRKTQEWERLHTEKFLRS